MEENTLEIKITGDDTGAGDSPASGVNSPIYDTEEGEQPASTVPRYQKQFDELLARSSKGLLTFDESLERVDRILKQYRDEIVDFHRERGDKRSFEEISTSARTRVGNAANGYETTFAKPTEQSKQQREAEQQQNARDIGVAGDAAQFMKKIGLGNFSDRVYNYLRPDSGTTPAGQTKAERSPGGQNPQLDNLERMARASLYTSAVANAGGRGATASSLVGAGVNIASTGVLGQGAAALAGSPIGLMAVAAAKIADVVVDKVADGFRGIQKNTQLGGDAAKGIIGNDLYTPVMKGAEHAAQSLEKIPIVGKVFAEQLRTASTVISVFKETVGAATARAKELQAYDSRIAQSFANQDVSRILADINEADRLGEQYGRIVDSQTDIMSEIKEIILPIKEIVVTDLADGLELLKVVLQILKPVVLNNAETLSSLIEVARGIRDKTSGGFSFVGGFLEGMFGFAQAANEEAMRKRMNDLAKNGETAMNQLFEMRDNRMGIPVVNQRVDVEGRGLEIPLLLGAR